MAKRWRPPRWAKPMKREKDEASEDIIRQLQIMINRRKFNKKEPSGKK
jgi:hypothetical protein